MKNEIEINNIKYKIVENYNDAIDKEMLKLKITDYYDNYDYIVGDWAYGKLRLKGFSNSNSKNFCQINDFNGIDSYIKNYCSFGCKYFILEKIDVENH